MLTKNARLTPPQYPKRIIDLDSDWWRKEANAANQALFDAWDDESYSKWWDETIPENPSLYLICMMCRHKLDELNTQRVKAMAHIDRQTLAHHGIW